MAKSDILTTFKIFGNTFKLMKAHITGLILGIVGWVFGWYSLVLITVSPDSNGASKEDTKLNGWFVNPTKLQNLGIVFAVLMGIVTWFQRVVSIQGDAEDQG